MLHIGSFHEHALTMRILTMMMMVMVARVSLQISISIPEVHSAHHQATAG